MQFLQSGLSKSLDLATKLSPLIHALNFYFYFAGKSLSYKTQFTCDSFNLVLIVNANLGVKKTDRRLHDLIG
jgi:hypothetical protein